MGQGAQTIVSRVNSFGGPTLYVTNTCPQKTTFPDAADPALLTKPEPKQFTCELPKDFAAVARIRLAKMLGLSREQGKHVHMGLQWDANGLDAYIGA